MPVVHYLLQTGQADPVPAMQALAAKGDIEALKDICCSRPPMHVHALTSALSYALAEKQGDVASLLIKQGANIYHADVAAAGRSAAPALYAALLLEDKKDYIEAYEEIGGAAKDLEHFRYVPPGYGLVPVSRLHIAARAGFFEDVVSVCHKEKKDFFTVKDILETDSAGVSLLDVMVARGDVQKLFDPRLWCQDPPAAEALRLVLKERGMEKENLDPASLQASIRVYKLRQQYDPARFKLKPPGR